MGTYSFDLNKPFYILGGDHPRLQRPQSDARSLILGDCLVDHLNKIKKLCLPAVISPKASVLIKIYSV